jgi:hypothetical protein
MKILYSATHRTSKVYRYEYWYEGHEGGWGFSFECDEQGHIDESNMPEAAKQNLALCRVGRDRDGTKVVDGGVWEYEYSWFGPAIGQCLCGAEVTLSRFTNTCDGCGADYNSGGQLLAPREQWGEETGESWTDIVRTP